MRTLEVDDGSEHPGVPLILLMTLDILDLEKLGYECVLHCKSTSVMANLGFIRVPSSINVTLGEERKFQCQHSDADTITWRINGTRLADYHPLHIVTHTEMSSSENHSTTAVVHILTIQEVQVYNETTIQCEAVFFDTSPSELSRAAVSLVQGPLNAVSNISVNLSQGLQLKWDPPFSLDLTNVDPDILYCIDVYKTTCGESPKHLIESDCTLSETTYAYALDMVNLTLMDSDLQEFILIPKSNSKGSMNGTASSIKERFLLPKMSPIIHKLEEEIYLSLQGDIIYSTNSLVKTPHSVLMLLKSTDDQFPISAEYAAVTNITHDSIILEFEGIKFRRLWSYVLFAQTCDNITVSNRSELSTHDIQNITIKSRYISFDFIDGSRALGALIITYSLIDSTCTDIHYSVIARRNGQRRILSPLIGLFNSSYNLSVFVVTENGLPFTRAAAIPKRLLNPKVVRGENFRKATLRAYTTTTKNSTCIKCVFYDETSQACVVVIHPKVSLLSSSSLIGLVNIEIEYLNRSGDQAESCINKVSLENYTTVVFVYNDLILGPPVFVKTPSSSEGNASNKLIFRIILPTALVLMLVTVLIVAAILGKIRKSSKRRSNDVNIPELMTVTVEMNQCSAYEFRNIAKRPVKMKANPAYEHREVASFR